MKIIQVGIGGFGQGWLARLQKTKGVELVAAVDVNADNLAAVRGSVGGNRCFTSLDDALDCVKADALLCVTPPRFHREVCEKAMRSGLHVLTEKPLSDTPADCRSILETSRKTRRVCTVSQQYRKYAAMVTIKRLLDRGAIGRVGQVNVQFHKGVFFGDKNFRTTMPYPLIIDMSIHHMDLIRYFTGRNAVDVMGRAWNPSWSLNAGDSSSSLVFNMAGGIIAEYSASWASKGDFADWHGNWRIEGDLGTILYSNGMIELLNAPKGYAVKSRRVVPTAKPRFAGQDAILHDFIAGVAKRQRTETDVTDNIHSVSMVFAAVKAVESGSVVKV